MKDVKEWIIKKVEWLIIASIAALMIGVAAQNPPLTAWALLVLVVSAFAYVVLVLPEMGKGEKGE